MVAQRGTVTAAAEALSYTPSAVSQQLRALGRELGVELLVHDGRGVRLSPAAQVLLARTDDLVDRWEQIRAEVARVAQTGGGVLRLAGFSTAASALLPGVAARVRAELGSEVQIIEADPEECFELLLTDRADIAVVVAVATLPASTDARFEQRHLVDDPIDLLVREGHPLAARTSVALRDLAEERWIMDRPGRPYHQLLQTACTEAGFTPSVAHFASEWDTGAALVGAGLGIALVPRLAQIPTAYPVVRVPLHGDPAPARHLRTGIRRGSREQPAIAAALTALEAVAQSRR